MSDLHLGKGRFLENGQHNILEDFEEDERFFEFLEYYCSGEFDEESVHLVLNGDILNLLQIDIDGVFLGQITEVITCRALRKIIDGHVQFFSAIQMFLGRPKKKITYIIGNHDAGMKWPSPQKMFRERVGGGSGAGEGDLLTFAMNVNLFGVHIEHGHRFEAMNSVPPSKYFMKGPGGGEILNLPWGSLFCIEILPRLKKERPFIDRVRPMSAYIKWCLIHDFYFFIRMNLIILKFLWDITLHKRDGKSWGLLSLFPMIKQLTLYPNYEKQARVILKKQPDTHTVIMGHTHLREWRKFPNGRFYFNCGTWNHIPTMDSGLHQDDMRLTFVSLKIDEIKGLVLSASMGTWQGKWRPYREDISLDMVVGEGPDKSA